MAYQRKTRDVWHFFVDYGGGWEHELDEYSLKEIRARKREYRENCPQYPTKVVKGRERLEVGAGERTLGEPVPGVCCPRCNGVLYKSELPDYSYQCFVCDEDFYGIEVGKEKNDEVTM